MGLVSPDYGTIFWMVLAFSLVFFLLTRFAWKPILSGLKKRENSIDEALQSAQKARDEMDRLQSEHEKIMREARSDRDNLLSEAREVRESLIDKAREEATKEAEKVLAKAREQIDSEKRAAMAEIKQQVSELSVQIAERILRKELQDTDQHEAMIEELMKDLKLN